MSLARQHRERILAAKAAASPDQEGGLTPKASKRRPAAPAAAIVAEEPTPTPIKSSLARAHRATALAEKAAIAAGTEGVQESTSDDRDPAAIAKAQMNLRLTHDLRRLKEIQSIEGKIAAKREMLPEYTDWIVGMLSAAADGAIDREDETLPTIMIWLIDTGDFAAALDLGEHVLKHNLPLPGRYQRTAPALITEEIADAALKVQSKGNSFPVAVLARVNDLTGSRDMHDEIRAKLVKAIGVELERTARESEVGTPEFDLAANAALAALRRAFELDLRIGVKTRIGALEKALKPKDSAGT